MQHHLKFYCISLESQKFLRVQQGAISLILSTIVLISYHSDQLQRCPLPDKHCISHGMCLYQVMMTLHFSKDVANDAQTTQKLKITS